ncbi:hypothetical protein K505DRAFT_344134 [Melanomma pulvis-pyrius CBS 109.77]|uniref:Uncharacterized protein n=1 Tax=Melanomma pulvis-pyrius CBS 109.77 TaxID=1314802 RepID=A0A6A6WQ60_9PLEO|nr:hypothetical protein K505DRAFT_344134 [Melanomma pulvis-pyrius CBS 109.77]
MALNIIVSQPQISLDSTCANRLPAFLIHTSIHTPISRQVFKYGTQKLFHPNGFITVPSQSPVVEYVLMATLDPFDTTDSNPPLLPPLHLRLGKPQHIFRNCRAAQDILKELSGKGCDEYPGCSYEIKVAEPNAELIVWWHGTKERKGKDGKWAVDWIEAIEAMT